MAKAICRAAEISLEGQALWNQPVTHGENLTFSSTMVETNRKWRDQAV